MTVQARIDWLKGRQTGIGGSEIAAIVGLNQYTTPMQIWESKVNPIVEDDETSEPAYWGNTLEEVVAQEYAKRTGRKIQRITKQMRHPDFQFAIANIDRAVINPEISGNVRNSPLWVNDPRQQLAYLATKRWSRLFCPDVILGVYTADEFEDTEPKDVTPQPTTSKTASIRNKVAAKKEAVKPKPQVIDAEPTPQDDAAFNDAMQSLEQSQTIDELKAHGKKIAESGFSEQQIADLTVAYKAKLKELQDVAAFEAQEAERLAAMEQ